MACIPLYLYACRDEVPPLSSSSPTFPILTERGGHLTKLFVCFKLVVSGSSVSLPDARRAADFSDICHSVVGQGDNFWGNF